jgi:hypothetical protein
MSVDYRRGVVGRDPIAKTVTEAMIAAHPDWIDEQVAERINEEVAHWRTQVAS